MSTVTISDSEFSQFQRFIYEAAGITMAPSKKALVSGRLAKRLQQCGVNSYGDYFRLLASGKSPAEVQTAVDLLTTNETYFFREQKHFELLREVAQKAAASALPFRVWSAASSSGEEAYSIAMVLADCLGERAWEVVGTDISTRVLERARTGHYPLARTDNIPVSYLKRFCLKGTGTQEGTLLIERSLRNRVKFLAGNLNSALPKIGEFDVIFLRNVMIYFNGNTKREVVGRAIALLKRGGYFLVGHSETLNDLTGAVQSIAPSIYRKP
jgi:chemotaxis protein methyltransferase CheR